ncbi:hypothetical protein HDV00_002435 [Rhizophlyctis rosea]|nr:hypothetical protein HDV00_002435 [Rhizophlyctis rosea]
MSILSEYAIYIPGYTDIHVIHVNTATSVVVQRARAILEGTEGGSGRAASKSVICKGLKTADEDEDGRIQREFRIMEMIHGAINGDSGKEKSAIDSDNALASISASNGDLSLSAEPSSMSPTSPTSTNSSTQSKPRTARRPRPRTGSLSQPSITGRRADRVVKPVGMVHQQGWSVIIMEDFGGTSLREGVLGGRRKGRRWISEPSSTHPPHLQPENVVLTNPLIPSKLLDNLIRSSSSSSSIFSGRSSVTSSDTSPTARLANVTRPPLEEFISIAVQLAEALQIIHGAQVIHKDINPDNIIVRRDPQTNQIEVQVVDFNLAEVMDSRFETAPRNYVQGTLEYLSPAKTPDERYQSASGLRHDLTNLISLLRTTRQQNATPPDTLLTDTEVFDALKDVPISLIGAKDYPQRIFIPTKLYGREKEQRQLRQAFERVAGVMIGGVAIGEKSKSEVVLVKGTSGTGKSSLVLDLRDMVEERGGFFVTGKYEDTNYQRPFDGFIQAVTQLIRHILTEPSDVLDHWTNRLKLVINGDKSRIACELVPELELILGHPDTPNEETAPSLSDVQKRPSSSRPESAGGSTAGHAATSALHTIIAAFADVHHPVVMYIDNMQFMDHGSQKLLEHILLDSKATHFLIIAAVRGKEAGIGTPFSNAMERLTRKVPERIHRLTLEPLTQTIVREMLSDVLKPSKGDLDSLATVICSKTLGNPFHVWEIVQFAEQAGLVAFDDVAEGWVWDISEIESQTDLSDNVVDLLVRRMKKLSGETLGLLQLAACIGQRFDPVLLSSTTEMGLLQVARILWPAVKEGFLFPTSGAQQQIVRSTQPRLSRNLSNVGSEGGSSTLRTPPGSDRMMRRQSHSNIAAVTDYKFCHERVQTTALSMLDPAALKQNHLKIARTLRRSLSEFEVDDRVYEILNHYNYVMDLVTDPEELAFIARLNLTAGSLALKTSAYAIAKRYLDGGLELLSASNDPWKYYSTCFGLHTGLVQVASMEGNYVEAERLLKELLLHASFHDHVIVAGMLGSIYIIQGKFVDILDFAGKELKAAGLQVPLTEEECHDKAVEELRTFESLTQGKTKDQIMTMSRNVSPELKHFHAMLSLAAGAATNLGLIKRAEFLTLRACTYSVQNGFGRDSVDNFAFACRTYLTLVPVPNLDRIRYLTELVQEYLPTAPQETRARARLGMALCGSAYLQSFSEIEANLDNCIVEGKESGFFSVVLYVMFTAPSLQLSFGRTLASIKAIDKKYRPFLERFRGHFLSSWNAILNELDAISTGAETVAAWSPEVMVLGMSRLLLQSIRLMRSVYYDRPEMRENLRTQQKELQLLLGQVRYRDLLLNQILVCTHEWETASEEKRAELLKEIDEAIETLKLYTDQEPHEQFGKYMLVQAERARLMNDVVRATDWYEKAAAHFHSNGFRMHEALTAELYGKFWYGQGAKRVARGCLTDAVSLWRQWGSEGKARQIVNKYADIMENVPVVAVSATGSVRTSVVGSVGALAVPGSVLGAGSQVSSLTATTGDSHGTSSVDLDLTTMLKVSQSISNDTNLETLLEKIVNFVVENAGARKGCLVLSENGKLFIQASGSRTGSTEEVHSVLEGIPIEGAPLDKGVPTAIVLYVFRTRDAIILSDASTDMTYSKDPYVRDRQTKSVLCCPIMHQNSCTGVVYLENDLQTSAFTQERLDLIQSLMSSASIAIENAKLLKTNTELTAALKDSTTRQRDAAPRYKVESPIKKAMEMLQLIKERLPSSDNNGAKQIDVILRTLASADLYASNIDEMNDEQGRGIDQDTRSWIENSLLQKSTRSKVPSKDVERMFSGGLSGGWSRLSIDGGAGTTGTRTPPSRRTSTPPQSQATSTPLTQVAASRLKEVTLVNMEEIEEWLNRSTTSDFNVLEFARVCQGRPLYFLGYHLLEYYGLIEGLGLDESKVRAFFMSIEAAYHPLPYHNSTHAADVLQTVDLLLLSEESMAVNFTKMEIFSACVASAIHDVDHPGVNNSFLVQTTHPLAIFYNDTSVLEFHHASKAFDIAQKPETNIFDGLDNDRYREARKLIISMVVATDMAQHFTYINKLKTKIAAGALKLEDAGDRGLALEIAIKCADLNNPTKPKEQSVQWAMRVMEEFFEQGDREKKMGLPVSKFMDRNDTNIPKCQIGFMDVLVVPLFDAWSGCIQTDFTRLCMDNIASNRKYWEQALVNPEIMPPPPPKKEVEIDGTGQVRIVGMPPYTFVVSNRRTGAGGGVGGSGAAEDWIVEEEEEGDRVEGVEGEGGRRLLQGEDGGRVGAAGESRETPPLPSTSTAGPKTPPSNLVQSTNVPLATPVPTHLRPIRTTTPRPSAPNTTPTGSRTHLATATPSPPPLAKSASGGQILGFSSGSSAEPRPPSATQPQHQPQRRQSANAAMMSTHFDSRNSLTSNRPVSPISAERLSITTSAGPHFTFQTPQPPSSSTPSQPGTKPTSPAPGMKPSRSSVLLPALPTAISSSQLLSSTLNTPPAGGLDATRWATGNQSGEIERMGRRLSYTGYEGRTSSPVGAGQQPVLGAGTVGGVKKSASQEFRGLTAPLRSAAGKARDSKPVQ